MDSILVPEGHPFRPRVEAHIRSTYKAVYAARVMAFPGLLVAGTSAAGAILCSAGIRTEGTGFFSEIYLNKPLECVISQAMGRPVARSEILEIVSLAFQSIRPCLGLLDAVTVYGLQHGHKWCLFTGTNKLRRLLRLTGLEVIKIAPASSDKINEPGAWGDYYATDPWVCLLESLPCAPLELSHRNRRGRAGAADTLPDHGLRHSA